MDPRKALQQLNAASHSQHLISYIGGNGMLEVTPNDIDISYEGFMAAADGTFGSKGLSKGRSSSQILRPTFSPSYEISPHLVNSLRSQQPALGSSFHSSSGSSPDWAREQSGAANDDVPSLSPFIQAFNLGHNHQPQHVFNAQMVVSYAAPQAQEHMGQDIELESQYSDQYSPLHPGALFQGSLSTPGPPQLLLPDSPPSGSARQHYVPSSVPRAFGLNYQASPDNHSGHGSQDGAPTVVISSPSLGDMDNMLTDVSMLNSPDFSQGGSFIEPPPFTYNAMAQPGRGGIDATGSAAFTLSADLQSSSCIEATRGYYTSSETASTTATCPPATGRVRGKGKGKAKAKAKGKGLQITEIPRRRRVSESHFDPFGSPASQSLDRSPIHGSFSRRNSSGFAMVSRSHPYTSEAADGHGESTKAAKGPKPRGKRVGPLREGNRELATKRRNDRTVCIGCKMAKVMCAGREDGGVCERCASSHSSAPKPFVCAPASFFELVQQGSTALLALHAIYPLNPSTGLREPLSLPAEIRIRDMLHFIDDLQQTHGMIRVYAGRSMLYELNLRACWIYVNSTCPPMSHPFQQFIDGLKIQKQDGWKACIRDGHGRPMGESLCDALLAMDDMAPWVRYTLVSKDSGTLYADPNSRTETFLSPGDEYHRQVIIVAAQLSRIIGRKLELQFYDHLKKILGNPNICTKLVLDVGRTLLSLRRRLVQWKQTCAAASLSATPEHETCAQEGGDTSSSAPSNRVSRIKSLCQVLYVYFCYMRRRLSPDEQEGMRTTQVWYPDRVHAVKESFPQYESIEGFEDWLQFKEQPTADAELGFA